MAFVGWILISVALAGPGDVAHPMLRDGAPGIWFTLPEAKRLNRVDKSAPVMAKKMAALEKALAESNAAVEAAEKREWYESPALWLAGGMLAGVLVTR